MKQGTPVAAEFTAAARAHLEADIADPELREKLWPDYPIGRPVARCAAVSTGSGPRTGRRWPPSPSYWSPARTRPR